MRYNNLLLVALKTEIIKSSVFRTMFSGKRRNELFKSLLLKETGFYMICIAGEATSSNLPQLLV